MYSSTQQLVSKYMKSLSLINFTNQDYKSFWENKTILFCIDGFFSGQNRVKCSLHSLFLTIDYKRTRFFLFGRFLQN